MRNDPKIQLIYSRTDSWDNYSERDREMVDTPPSPNHVISISHIFKQKYPKAITLLSSKNLNIIKYVELFFAGEKSDKQPQRKEGIITEQKERKQEIQNESTQL